MGDGNRPARLSRSVCHYCCEDKLCSVCLLVHMANEMQSFWKLKYYDSYGIPKINPCV